MNRLVRIYVAIVILWLPIFMCDETEKGLQLYQQKCQDYLVEDGHLDEPPLVIVKILEKPRIGITISVDTILIVENFLTELFVHNFKVYLGHNSRLSYTPELVFTKDRYILLKMSESDVARYPKKRACLQHEFPELTDLRILFFNRDDDLNVQVVGNCVRSSDEEKVCARSLINSTDPATYNNSMLLHMEGVKMNVVGVYVQNEQQNVGEFQLIDDQYIKWIEKVVWSTETATIRDSQHCGQVKLSLTPLITYGVSTSPGEFPWHVAIYKDTVYICGGTIINTRTIITAAHCIQYGPKDIASAESLSVEVGIHNRANHDEETQMLQVQSVIPHEHFDNEYKDNDIALLRVAESIVYSNFAQPICLQRTIHQNMAKGVVPGWGRDELGNLNDVLHKGYLVVQPIRKCRRTNRGFFRQYLTDGNFCAGYENGTNVCHGDSGGGLVIFQKDSWFLRGIVSLGRTIPIVNQCDTLHLSLFTNTTYFYDWIMNKSALHSTR